MRNKLKIILAGSIIMMLALGMSTINTSPPSNTVNLSILKVDGVWKVVQSADHKNFKVKVKKNTKIIWTAHGSDVSFQFPNFLFSPVDAQDTLISSSTKFLKNGKKLKLMVKSYAPSGTFEYAVFCTTDGAFAIGGSPPKIIIE